MADQCLTQTQFEDLMYQVTIAILGGSPPADVRILWPSEGAPAFKRDDNVTFIQAMEVDDEYNRQRDFQYENAGSPVDHMTQRLTYTRVMEVTWVCYGPNAYDNASLIRDKMQYLEIVSLLYGQKVFQVPLDIAPRRMPDIFPGGQWANRYDLTMRFNEEIKREVDIGYVKSVEIDVERENRETVHIDVTE